MSTGKSRKIHQVTFGFLIICLIVLFCFVLGCIESEDDSFDLSKVALTIDDVDPEMESFSEDHITTPYVVEDGKLFEGMLVYEKYEIVFMKNASYFLVQQLARVSDEQNASVFLSTLKENDTIPGLISDYVFDTVTIDQMGDQSVLKTSVTLIDGNLTTLYLLVFQKDDIVCILVSGSLSQETIRTYGSKLMDRLQKNNDF